MKSIFHWNPSSAFAILPSATLYLLIYCCVIAISVLFTIHPLAFVLTAVFPSEDTISMLFVILELSFVDSSVLPLQNTVTLHLIRHPLTFVLSIVRLVIQISPSVLAVSLNHIVFEIAGVGSFAVFPFKGTLSVSFTFVVLAVVISAIWPCLFTFSVLLIEAPFSFVVSSIRVDIDSFTMSFIVSEISLIHI